MKTTKIVEVGTKEYKAIAKEYNKLKDKLKDGRLDISAPPFDDDVDTIIIFEVGEDADYVAEGKKLANGSDKYIVCSTDNTAIGSGITLGTKLVGQFKAEPPKLPEIVDTDGNAIESVGTEGTLLARELGNMPANHLTPRLYAQRIRDEFKGYDNVVVDVIAQADLEELGMNTLLSVGHGSDEDSYVVTIEYKGTDGDIETAIVGKGVTFDTGGISLKPGAKMHEMKMDMCGSAAVVGAMKDLANEKAKVNVVAIVGLVENMPSGRAVKPGDVVTSYKGITVENHNTDAEGRLVLCDLIAFIQDEYKSVNKVVDIATLTGAILVSLADQYAGFFTNSVDMYRAFKEHETKDERYWLMPMGPEFAKQLDSNVADIKNLGNGHPGSTTAAEFLYKFVDEGVSWAHLDVAGTAMVGGEATGFGVKSLAEFVRNYSTTSFDIDEDMKY